MNRKGITLLITILALFSTRLLVAQVMLKVDYKEIERRIQDKNKDSHYPKLLKRYNAFDKTLTPEEYMLIYYGFSFQNTYLSAQNADGKLAEIAKSKDYKKLIAECERVLQINPVSLSANNLMAMALFESKKTEEGLKYQNRYRAIRKTIATSGDGRSCETALKVIFIADEYNMLYSYFDVEKIHGQKLVGLCDYFEVDPTQYLQAKDIYFDISRKLIATQKRLEGKK
ncbi:DUF4919 domain-containing protein [Sphingobacterium yanglingense]|uniref:Uncharacterized protein DUF4919 n=1 Tax=Sphingobacterium yanglingense TaxID=1437280 RepID=A0A4R6WES5_9SPHI|nr:DUF4919 domain-containing protein [Sphingobacterium yanglingense]TDQ78312.1 uncharacterized protein DUF4919 [Sphingobacterium yanglingense]